MGDQKLTKGNKAIARHREHRRTLRLFSATGHLEGTSTRTHVYIGAFEVDRDIPYVRQSAPDDNDEERSVLVFRLRPVGATEFREEDRSSTGDVAPESGAELIDAEATNAREFPIQPGNASVGTRTESALVERFMAWHPSGRAAFKRWKVRPKGELKDLFTDIFDTKTRTLYEAKGHATRSAVREAIGQLLDYRRHIVPPPASSCVLLPERPTDDLVNLITSLGMSCAFGTTEGNFSHVDADEMSIHDVNAAAKLTEIE